MTEREDSKVCMRLSPVLAQEIGLNESIVLMQLQYLTHVSEFDIEGHKWTRGTLPYLIEKYFPFLSAPTLSRVIASLEKQNLIKIGNFNKFKYDRTQWFTVLLENCLKLNGFYVFQNETSIFQNDDMEAIKMKDASYQNERTIQENQEQIKEESKENIKSSDDSPEPKPEKRKTRKPEKPFPEDFQVTEKMRAYFVHLCIENGVDVDIGARTEHFKDNAIAKDLRYVNWEAAWRTWVRNAIEKGWGVKNSNHNGANKNAINNGNFSKETAGQREVRVRIETERLLRGVRN